MDLFDSPIFTAHVNQILEKWHVPGLAIGIVQDGVAKSRGYGKASLEPGKESDVDTETMFEIASCSKSLTAAAVALLVADDEKYPQVQWDTPVSELLPDDFALASDEYTKGVTVEDILSHRTGLPGHDLASMSPRAAKPDTPQSVVRKLRHLELSAPIRSKWMYSNLMFTTAAYLVEHLSGVSFREFLKTHIWKPLGMKSTNLQSRNAIEAGFTVAKPYKWDDESSSYRSVEMQYAPEAVGAGLVVTTADDYIRWLSAFLNKKDPITQEVYDALTKARSFEEDDLPPYTSPELYSAGLGSHYYRGYEVIGHDGGDPGVGTTLFFMPKLNFGCVIFGNATAAGNVHPILRHELVDAALKIPDGDRIDWASRERQEEDKYLQERKEKTEERRKAHSRETDGKASPQPGSLERYTGRYWNDGYEEVKVTINQKGNLFIDANDRTMGFTLEFEHLHGGVKYMAHMSDYFEAYQEEMEAEFVIEDDRPVRLGINLETDVKSQRIWFDRVDGKKRELVSR